MRSAPALSYLDETSYLSLVSESIAQALRPWREIAALPAERRSLEERIPRYAVLTPMLLIPLGSGAERRDEAIAKANLAGAALALKAYHNKTGSYPASLDELRQVIPWKVPEDPFSGRPLIYKRQGAGFLIYSIGADLRDDGGRPPDPLYYERGGTGTPPGDMIWRDKS